MDLKVHVGSFDGVLGGGVEVELEGVVRGRGQIGEGELYLGFFAEDFVKRYLLLWDVHELFTNREVIEAGNLNTNVIVRKGVRKQVDGGLLLAVAAGGVIYVPCGSVNVV